jgi:hypothetical protein
VTAAERRTVTVTVPLLESEEQQPLSSGARDASHADHSEESSTASRPANWNGNKTAAVALAGVGAAAIVVGVVEGLAVFRKRDAAEAACPGWACAEPGHSSAISLLDEGRKARTLSIVANSAGAAMLIGAGLFWFTSSGSAPSAGSTGAMFGSIGPRHVSIGATW